MNRKAHSQQKWRGGDDRDACDSGNHQRAPEHRLFLCRILPAHGLRDKSGGGRPQEIERGKDKIEQDGGNRQPAQKRGIAQTADNSSVDQTQKRCGQKRQRHRHRNSEHHGIVDLKGPCLRRICRFVRMHGVVRWLAMIRTVLRKPN
jgi:hypothetical protein